MLQPTLLLVEIVLVGVTGYLLWLARKTLANAQKDAAELIASAQNKLSMGVDPAQVKMAQDVGVLLNELRRTAGSVQAEWVKRQETMQATISRAEAIEERLQDLLAQANSAPAPAVLATRAQPPTSGLAMVDALERFRQFLLNEGRTEKTVDRQMSHVTGFAAWWGGHRYEQANLTRLNAESVEAYLNHLRSQDYQPSTIDRKAKAVWAFRHWINNVCLVEAAPAPSEAPPSAAPIVTGVHQADATVANRRRMVEQLAGQGMDYREIAAQTGLEQEAVRILLTIARNDNGLQA